MSEDPDSKLAVQFAELKGTVLTKLDSIVQSIAGINLSLQNVASRRDLDQHREDTDRRISAVEAKQSRIDTLQQRIVQGALFGAAAIGGASYAVLKGWMHLP